MEQIEVTKDQKEILKMLMEKFINKKVTTSLRVSPEEDEREAADQKSIRELYKTF
jgi:hypothetical protein